MGRNVSTSCGCNYTFEITCPQLKQPVAPVPISPIGACCLSAMSTTIYSNPIWAYGDTQRALNGNFSVCSDMSCCFVYCCVSSCCPCVSISLTDCLPALYYWNMRFVSSSYEVSPYSATQCFCIKHGCYQANSNCEVMGTGTADTVCFIECTGTCGATNNVRLLWSCTCTFDCCTICCDYAGGSCSRSFPELKCAGGSIRPAGTYYLKAFSKASANNQVCCEGSVNSYCIFGCSYIFALACDVPCSCCTFCTHLVLYGLYEPENGYASCANKTIAFKYEVSCDNTFATGVVTACGPYNVFIPRTCFACLACTHYVRQCVLCGATPFVQCSTWNNVVLPTCLQCSECWFPSGCISNMATCGTIGTNNTIAVLMIGSGGPGQCHEGCSGLDITYCAIHRCCVWCTSSSGGSGFACFTKFSGKNGCCFAMLPGASTCSCCYACCLTCYAPTMNATYIGCLIGNTCTTMVSGFPSIFELKTSDGATKVCRVCALGGCYTGCGGSGGATGCSAVNRRKPVACMGMLRFTMGGSAGQPAIWWNCCNSTACLTGYGLGPGSDACTPWGDAAFMGYCCTGDLCACAGDPSISCCWNPTACCCRNSPSGSLIGANIYGYGGQGMLYCGNPLFEGVCFQTYPISCAGTCSEPGYGFGGGGVGSCQYISTSYNLCFCCHPICMATNGFGCGCGAFGGGGGGGLLFMCQYNYVRADTCGSTALRRSGRHGLVVFACQGF